MTKREMFEAIKNVEGVKANAKMVEFLDKQIELVSKKRTSLTPAQKENAELVEKIYDFMVEAGKEVTIAEIVAEFNLSSGQKASALVKKLVDAERVTKGKDGKIATYKVAE